MTVAEIFETMEYGPAPESASTALKWIADQGAVFGLFIGGAWREAADGATFETINPATGKTLARVAQAGQADIEAAVAAARGAQPGWWGLGGHARARYLY